MASLVGKPLPNVSLIATDGNAVDLSKLEGRVVLFCYPYTGRPGHADPEGWDTIPGAHGSTPQALAFSKCYDEFRTLHAKVFGMSFQSTQWQQEFVIRNSLAFTLLSDEQKNLSNALGLETFKAGAVDFLKRRTFIIVDGIIINDIYPVDVPEQNAAEILKTLRQ